MNLFQALGLITIIAGAGKLLTSLAHGNGTSTDFAIATVLLGAGTAMYAAARLTARGYKNSGPP